MTKHFISYSRRDGAAIAHDLRDRLLTSYPRVDTWIDDAVGAGEPWPDVIDEAISRCATMLFVMTEDSIVSPVCSKECARARTFKKPIVPLRFVAVQAPPLLLEDTNCIDFQDREVGMAQLRLRLTHLNSPEGELEQLESQRKSAERDLKTASEADRLRIQVEVDRLKSDIARQRAVVVNPAQVAKATEATIAEGIERERQPTVSVPKGARPRFINRAPTSAPSHFRDRHLETKLLGDFLANQDGRLATVVGRGGTGKTAMVCRLLKALERGELPDDLGPLPVSGIVYLSGASSRRITAPTLFADMCKLLSEDQSRRLEAMAQSSQFGMTALFEALLEAFPVGRTVVLLDNFESLMDEEHASVRDESLREALQAVLNASEHGVKVVITTRIQPRDIGLTQPGRQLTINLDRGLESPYAEEVLQALDQDGTVGLRSAPQEVLRLAGERTRGLPRALEMLVASLRVDRSTSLPEILAAAGRALPESVVEVMVGEAFRRLDRPAQEILEALAVYEHAVPAVAVDYLLQPFQPTVDSEAVLNRLVNTAFARVEAGRYFLHPVDCDYARGRVPEGEVADASVDPPPWTRLALLHRAADYFVKTRVAREKVASISDLAAEQAEIDLRCAAGDADTAARVTLDISPLMERWGHFRLMDLILRRTAGKVHDPLLRIDHALAHSWARSRLGDLTSSLDLARTALTLSQEQNDPMRKASAMRAVANVLTELGATEQAIALLEDATKLAKAQTELLPETRAFWLSMELGCLCNLGGCYKHFGSARRALEYERLALKIARDIGDADSESFVLNNIADTLRRLGQPGQALESARQGLQRARDQKNRLTECSNLTNIGIASIDAGRLSDAIACLKEAVEIADDVANRQFQDEARQPLALAYFCAGDLKDAEELGEEALDYGAAQQNQPQSGLLAFLGVIALRRGDREKARQRFEAALAEANKMLSGNPKHFAVQDAKGLALCGLAACGQDGRLAAAQPPASWESHDGGRRALPDGLLEDATVAYRAARALTRDAGVVLRAQRLFEALRAAAPLGLLDPVRGSMDGTDVQEPT